MSDKDLIVYYSWSGNTAKIARLIERKIGGDLIEIKIEEAYPSSYNDVVDQAKKEIRKGYKPSIKTEIDNIESYNRIFIGSPNWWSTIAPPVATFLSKYDLSEKTVLPFLTHGGGGQGRMVEDIAKLCPELKIKEELVVYGSGSGDVERKISDWLDKLA